MKLNSILNTYFNPKGTISNYNYLVGVALAIIILVLSNLENFSFSIINFLEPRTWDDNLLLGLKESKLYSKSITGLFLTISDKLLLIPAMYMLVCITYKRCRTLHFSKIKTYLFSILLCFSYFFFHTDLYNRLTFIFDIYFLQNYFIVLKISISIIVLLIGVSTVYSISKHKTEENAKIQPLLYLFLLAGIYFMILFVSFAIYLGWVLPVTFILLIGGYIYILSPKSSKIWVLYMAFIIIEALYIVLLHFVESTWLLVILNNVITCIEKIAYLLSPALVFKMAILKNNDSYQPLFNNTMLNNIFDFRGTLNSRAYKASLLMLVIFFNLSHIPALQELMTEYIEIGYYRVHFSFFRYLNSVFSIFFLFYSFITIYIAFVVNIKRARAKSLPMIIGWINGTVMYLAIMVINTLVLYYRSSYDFTRNLLIILLALMVLSIGIVIFMSQKTKDDKELPKLKEFSPESYLFYLFNASLLFTAIRLLLAAITSEVSILDALIGIIYFGLFIYLAYNRLKDAQIKLVWLISVLIAFVALEFLVLKTGYNIFVFLVECVCFLHIVLIVMPSKQPHYLDNTEKQ